MEIRGAVKVAGTSSEDAHIRQPARCHIWKPVLSVYGGRRQHYGDLWKHAKATCRLIHVPFRMFPKVSAIGTPACVNRTQCFLTFAKVSAIDVGARYSIWSVMKRYEVFGANEKLGWDQLSTPTSPQEQGKQMTDNLNITPETALKTLYTNLYPNLSEEQLTTPHLLRKIKLS